MPENIIYEFVELHDAIIDEIRIKGNDVIIYFNYLPVYKIFDDKKLSVWDYKANFILTSTKHFNLEGTIGENSNYIMNSKFYDKDGNTYSDITIENVKNINKIELSFAEGSKLYIHFNNMVIDFIKTEGICDYFLKNSDKE